MGKLKKNSRSSRHRKSPLGRKNKNADDAISKQDDGLTKNKIMPLLNQLSSSSPNDRSMALGAITVLSEDAKFRKLLLKQKILQILLEQGLSDDNSEIIVESFGLLRNFVIEEGYDVAIYLWRQGIWKTIETNISKAKVSFDSFQNGKNNSKIEKSLLFDYIENLISLIIGLVNTDDNIFEQVFNNVGPVLDFINDLLKFCSEDLKINITLFNSILEFIYEFSSQSNEFISLIVNDNKLDLSLLNKEDHPRYNELTKIYIQGISLQLFESTIDSKQISKIILKLLSIIKPININEIRTILNSTVDNTKPEELNKDSKLRIESRSKLQAIELSIELITAIFEIISSREDIDNELISIIFNEVPLVLIELLKYEEFINRSLICLNNLCWFSIEIQYSNEEWINTNKSLFNIITSLNIEDIDDKITSFGIIWSILIINPNLTVSNEFVDSIINEINETLKNDQENKNNNDDDELKSKYLTNLIRVLGDLSKQQNQIERNSKISLYLLNLIESLPSNSIISSTLIIEILDLFYEIYGDSSFDYDLPNYVNNDYNSKLRKLITIVKPHIKFIDRKVQPELKDKADEVFNNLSRFIQYKETERN